MDLTFGIKHTSTFAWRRYALASLVTSIRVRHAFDTILVAYDGTFDYRNRTAQSSLPSARFIRLEGVDGVSAGRNCVVRHAVTAYVMIMDDDVEFSRDTRVDALLAPLQQDVRLALVAACYAPSDCYALNASETNRGSTVRLAPVPATSALSGLIYADVAHNVFVARTASLRAHPWDERQKLMEHKTFFLALRKAGWAVAVNPLVTITHNPRGVFGSYRSSQSATMALFLPYVCRNFPRVRHWTTPYWDLNCRAWTASVSERTIDLVERTKDDSSVVPHRPGDLTCFVAIVSAVQECKRRDLLRRTWLTQYGSGLHAWDYGFFVGVDHETDGHMLGDVVHLRSPDDYGTLGLKTAATLTWVLQNVNTSFVLKTDTDSWVHVTHLCAWMVEVAKPADVDYAGSVTYHAPADTRGKWKVDKTIFGDKHYPDYATGGGYILSLYGLALIKEAFSNGEAPVIPNVEDASVGIAVNAQDITPIPMNGIFLDDSKARDVDMCCRVHVMPLVVHKPRSFNACQRCATDALLEEYSTAGADARKNRKGKSPTGLFSRLIRALFNS